MAGGSPRSLGNCDPSRANTFGQLLIRTWTKRSETLDLRQVQAHSYQLLFCPQIQRVSSSGSPCLQKGDPLDAQKHPPRPEATISQKGDPCRMEHVNLVSASLLSPGMVLLRCLRLNPSRELEGQLTSIQETLAGQGKDRAGLSTGAVGAELEVERFLQVENICLFCGMLTSPHRIVLFKYFIKFLACSGSHNQCFTVL